MQLAVRDREKDHRHGVVGAAVLRIETKPIGMPPSDPSRKRCAIYTRKSSEEGLEQEFNSLQAQSEACEAYIRSQHHEGWVLARTRYDDGGLSGGSMARPGLQRLLADIQGGRIDIIVVYKVDRLTRSLADFARLVEIFDAQGVSFVSVTQQFNTTSSMGRLTLNVLLSFAQFEREVTGERIRERSPPRRKRACGWAVTSRSATTRASAHSPSTLPRPRPCVASSPFIVSSAACAGSRRRPTAWGSGQSTARGRALPRTASGADRCPDLDRRSGSARYQRDEPSTQGRCSRAEPAGGSPDRCPGRAVPPVARRHERPTLSLLRLHSADHRGRNGPVPRLAAAGPGIEDAVIRVLADALTSPA